MKYERIHIKAEDENEDKIINEFKMKCAKVKMRQKEAVLLLMKKWKV